MNASTPGATPAQAQAQQQTQQVTQQLTQRLKKAITVIDQLEGRLKKEIDARSEPIAIIGMACRLPGGVQTPEQYWQLLSQGIDAISEVPSARFDINQYYDPDSAAAGKISSRHGGFISGVDQFDASFFGITPREAATLDPQQRLLLEVSWEAMEDANILPERLYGSNTGVYVAMSGSDYMLAQAKYMGEAEISAYFGTGNAHAAACGRLSYTLGCQGPCFAVDTACSSSLVALHNACASLRSGESDMALVAAANLILTPDVSITFSRAHMLAADGRCKTFDAAADGYVRAEGVAGVFLKRLSDARRDGDPIRAVILGSALNQDGPSAGLTVPNGVAQQAVIRQALKNARLQPDQVDYVEAHGTGTSLGDPIEIGALGAVYGSAREPGQHLLVGSVKTNIGHTEACAGMAGLIKLVLALEHEQLPAHLHCQQPSPLIPWDKLNVAVTSTRQAWQPGPSGRRIGALSSFGFGGSNGHLILASAPGPQDAPATQSAPPATASTTSEKPMLALKISTRSAPALAQLAARHAQWLGQSDDASVADYCLAANTRRTNLPWRNLVFGQDRQALIAALQHTANDNTVADKSANEAPELAWLFTGQGSQFSGMGQALYQSPDPLFAAFRSTIDECQQILAPLLAHPLTSILWGEHSHLLDQTQYTQPALFALQVALARCWQALGIKPDALLGHSVGEYAAAVVAGVFSLADGARLIAARAELMVSLCQRGGMAVLFAEEDRIVALLPTDDSLAIAAYNGQAQLVVSGSHDALQSLLQQATAQGIEHKMLAVSHAFHSPMMLPMLARFAGVAQAISYQQPTLPLYSTVTGQLETSALANADYWVRHVSAPVRFAQAFTALSQDANILLEVGPGNTLLGMGRRVAQDQPLWLIASLPRQPGELLYTGLRQLYQAGVEPDWARLGAGSSGKPVRLPGYPFQHQRYWYPSNTPLQAAAAAPALSAQEQAWLNALRQADVGALDNVQLDPALRSALGQILQQLQPQAGATVASSLPLVNLSWHSAPLPALPAGACQLRGATLILASDDSQVSALRHALQAQGMTVEVVLPAQWPALLAAGHQDTWQRVLFYRPDHETTLENAASLTHALLQMLRLAVPEMWLITRAALCCDATDSEISPSQACLWGAANAIAAELPEQFYAAIDLADLTRPGITAQEAGHIVALLANAALMRSFDQVALRADGARYPRLEARPTPVGTLLPLNSDASYLVSGAFGGLGLVVCDWLVQRGARHLVLVSRSGPTRPEAQQALQRWQAQAVQVHLLHADVADQAALLAGWQTIAATLPPLKGVFHLAGISGEPTPGEQLTLAALQQVLAPKLAGTLNLLALSADAKLDYLVLFSSIASVWGSARQAAYCAANQCIDSLAAALLAQGARVCAINWGPWAEVGMGRVLDQGDQMARIGIQGFSNHDALIWLETMMSNQAHLPQALAVQANWNQFVPLFASRRHNSLLQALPTVASNDGGSASQAALRSALLANPRHQWRAQLLDALGRIVRKICQLDSNHGLPATQGFTELGIDSLMAVELKDQLQKELGLKLAATISFDYPTMDAMVRYLEQRLADEVTPAQTGQAPPVSASAGQAAPAASSVQAIEDMSEDEAEALLMAKLQSL